MISVFETSRVNFILGRPNFFNFYGRSLNKVKITTAADDSLEYFFIVFLENIRLDIL